MKLNFSKKILILSLSIFVSVLTLDVVFTCLLLGKISDINSKIMQLNISNQKKEEELSLQDSIDGSRLERKKLTEYFVESGNAKTVEFTEYLEDLALEAGVIQKKSLNYEPINGLNTSETVSAIRYRFNITGKWANTFYFLQLIENLPKVMSLKSVSMSVSPDAISASQARSRTKTWQVDLDFFVAKLND